METPDVRSEPLGKRHARLMGRLCRETDRKMLISLGNWTDPERFVRAQANRSLEAWAFYKNEILVGVAGILLVPGKYQLPWYLGTYAAEDAALLPAAQRYVDNLRNKYDLLLGMVPCADPKLLEICTRLGFSVMAPKQFGAKGDLWCKVVLDTRRIVEASDARY